MLKSLPNLWTSWYFFVFEKIHICNIRTKNPKEYWKVINEKVNTSNKTSIDIDDLYKYFGDLNKLPEISDEINSMVEIDVANLQSSNLSLVSLVYLVHAVSTYSIKFVFGLMCFKSLKFMNVQSILGRSQPN